MKIPYARRLLAVSAAAALSMTSIAIAAAPANAAAVSDPSSATLASPATHIGSLPPINALLALPNPALGGVTFPLTPLTLTVDAKATWEATATTDIGYESDDVRQGATLDVSRTVSAASGSLDVVWTIEGTIRPFDIADIDIDPVPVNADSVTCNPRTAGGNYTCTAQSARFPLFDPAPFVPLSPYVDLVFVTEFEVTPEAITATRTFTIGGKAAGPTPGEINMDTLGATESITPPCTAAAGQSVTYALSNPSWTPETTVDQSVDLAFGVWGIGEKEDIDSTEVSSLANQAVTFALAGSGDTTDMGALQANNVKPVLAPVGPFTGTEGTAVELAADASASVCEPDSYVWQLSDGSSAFGATPQHVFADNGVYSGQVTVTDVTGLSSSKAFSATVSNVAPVADAGPDTASAWGRTVTFTAQAVDPGSADQSTLKYSWDFGDGTPPTAPSSAGASVTHAYATPDVYTATVTVCDKNGACDTDTRETTVRTRTTTVAYTGANTGTHSATASLAASVVDEFGQAVSAAAVAFNVGGTAAGSASTSAAGTASRTWTVTPVVGDYPVSAVYAASALYEAATSAVETFTVSAMSSTVTYTGARSGGPNKVVTLSAKLVDGLGRPLAGKTVAFTLGTQSASAVTSSTGVASVALKLAQKVGSYQVTAAWTPTGGDETRWTGDTDAMTFSLKK